MYRTRGRGVRWASDVEHTILPSLTFQNSEYSYCEADHLKNSWDVYYHCYFYSVIYVNNSCFSQKDLQRSHVISQPFNSGLPWPEFFTTYLKVDFLHLTHLCSPCHTGEPCGMFLELDPAGNVDVSLDCFCVSL